MTEQKLPIPRMVEVRDNDGDQWIPIELLADMSGLGVAYPYVCRNPYDEEDARRWKCMREIPQPKTRPMTPRELLDAIRNGAVWRWVDGQAVYWDWNNSLNNEKILLCYDWHGNENDVWVKAEVTE